MEGEATLHFYVHLIPDGFSEIAESFKVSLPSKSTANDLVG